jgi:YVTN family beta-propeller protein
VIYNRLLSIAKTSTTVGAVLHLVGTQASAGNQASRSTRLAFTRFTRSAIRLAQPAIRAGVSIAAVGGLFALAGCGNQYRPVISAINPVGPASQASKYAVAISNPGPGLPGLVTFVDFSGDSVIITANIGVSPQYLALGSSGSTGYTINGDGTVNTFSISTSLLSSAVEQTTLLAGANPNMIFPEGTYTYITQPGRSDVAELSGTPPTLQQEISDIGQNPVYIAGVASAPRIYAISQGPLSNGVPTGAGTAAAIETSTNTVSSTIPVGTKPVYGVMTANALRAFVINQGSNNVTAINSESNILDTGTVSGNGTLTDPAAVAPIWADFAPTLNELVVANEGDGTTNGSVSIFSIPLCSSTAISNPNCSTTNPIDAVGFGTLVAHIPVGKNPLMIAALQDGSQAYVINQGDSTVSVINLTTDTVTATIPVPDTPNPTFIAVTTGAPGKVYVTSTSSTTMTVIRTDTNTVDTTVPLQGTGIQVRVTAN